MDLAEIAHHMFTQWRSNVASLWDDLTPAEQVAADEATQRANQALGFDNPLIAIMEMNLLAGMLLKAESERVRESAPEIAETMRRTVYYATS